MDSLRKNETQFLSASDMFILKPNQAPWGDIPRVAGLLGPAKENGFRINAHKVEPLLTREKESFASSPIAWANTHAYSIVSPRGARESHYSFTNRIVLPAARTK